MTRILALETATDACSVALWQDGALLARFEPGARRQTERVLPLVDELLAEAGIAVAQLDAIAFGHGPGAFTGVRVAVSVAQGLAFAVDIPVAGVSTLAACALAAHEAYPQHERVLAAFDARMGEVYLGAYRCRGEQADPLRPDALFAPAALPVLEGEGWLLAGSGAIYREQFAAATNIHQVAAEVVPTAAAVARLAVPLVRTGATVPAEQARPVYLRDKVV